MRKHFVTFYSPGTFVAEDSTREIDAWDWQKAIQMSGDIQERYGATPYGFRFRTMLCAEPVPDGEGGVLTVQPKEVESSGVYFIEAEIRYYDDVIGERDRICKSNMLCNNWPFIATTTNGWGWTQPFGPNDFNCVNGELIRGDDERFKSRREDFRKIYEAKWKAPVNS